MHSFFDLKMCVSFHQSCEDALKSGFAGLIKIGRFALT